MSTRWYNSPAKRVKVVRAYAVSDLVFEKPRMRWAETLSLDQVL